MSTQLQDEFEYFLAHHTELLKKYSGRVVVIHDHQVVGDYATELDALRSAQAKYKVGTFLVQRVEANPTSYTQTFHSRVSFA